MLSQEEAQRIAAAVNILRPDWNPAGLMTILADERLRVARTYRDVAIAFTAIATDPDSRKPTRILEHGPWWETVRPVGVSASAWIAPPEPSDCDICGRPPNWRHIDHVYQPRDSSGHGTHKPPELDELIADTRQQLTTSTKEPS